MSMWQGKRVPEITVTDIEAGAVSSVLLDVREADEWEAGHAPTRSGCRSVSSKARASRSRSTAASVASADPGSAPPRRAAQLIEWGFDAVNVAGGMRAWAESGEPVVRDDGSPGEVI